MKNLKPVISAILLGILSFVALLTLNAGFKQNKKQEVAKVIKNSPGLHRESVNWLPFTNDTVYTTSSFDELLVPFECVVDVHGNLYVMQYAKKEITKLSPTGKIVKKFGRMGSGPGEFRGMTRLGTSPNREIIYVCDGGNNRLVLFDTTGANIDMIKIKASSLSQVIMADKNIVAYNLLKNPLATVFSPAGEKLYTFGENITKSHLINQGKVRVSSTGLLYFSNDYTGIVQVYRPDGKFVTKVEGPIILKLSRKAIRDKNYQLSWLGNPLGTLDLCTDNDFLYTLFSGVVASKEAGTAGNASDMIHVYDASSGIYNGSIKLPGIAKNITVYGNRLYCITISADEESDDVNIINYNIEETIKYLKSNRSGI